MSNGATSASGDANPREVLRIELISDERVFVVAAVVRFAATLVKSDRIADDNSSKLLALGIGLPWRKRV
jgi:hypothetical protein